ncbi:MULTISPECIES: 16S rRNA (guanine(966)-N(2))-methyltransferase RsmD [unclassified Sphingopyxis]|uniref:16S rRNA (guanine(966)-N(2))-methyltransferase RsmD n=1 Tax=unclassified Sphingopyxis TaxID=2614943 RepID=UPI0007313168|nr:MULTISPECIES: 16S rRNA (guanine(966)-N(2))-methyltransferase RsmD [unclassified Sphingopyxis]KTE24158.1 16S rRNA (guanine(966)-N(2))-methyltransferase RsmD [Sphingopyxis sp. H057]KTE50455.1 16S rRNA (guanine(966)-N(2))-methyltransferase RsmD [Sphingopyxis sp. H073]KTE52544.1 16S rRNA (guanine(966)-N(2))-methyltransferase RsmD [Sphingopyxis sp. H071]KTE63037.1 16S rRNA (guanine(966)-N(2))-methyltransferase RsmD [Sphingopyxis sp. H107]KTE64926.1 16S rRNA (guanine(966)-N(2))-methyltransferase 
MRVISGEWRGRKLLAPKNDATRPTADRTRETLFSMLASRLGSFEGLHVADLFAGSGALGIEALSRGAAHCVFGEQDREAIDALRKNLAALGAAPRADVRAGSVLAVGPAPRPFDLLLFDAPYGTGAGSVALDKLNRLGWVGADSLISIETADKEAVEVAGFAIDAIRKVGKAKLTLLRPA